MGRVYFGFAALACAGALAGTPARAQPAAPGLMAQNTYNGGTVPSQDSILPSDTGIFPAAALRQEVQAAATVVYLGTGFMHTQYHENFPGSVMGAGDDESGFTTNLDVGGSVLLREDGALPIPSDLYAALDYQFSAGNIDYAGHYQTGQPLQATDRAVFNRIEARLGIGLPLRDGLELIPFAAAGYQTWNRNIDVTGAIGTDEFYHSAFAGIGLRLDLPVTPRLVVSGTAEALAMIEGGITLNGEDIGQNFGPSGQERLELALDYAARGALHVFGRADLEHFNYSGSQPKIYATAGGLYEVNEPLSVTTQFGANIGLAYSF